jgi:hypothetical protein
MCASAHLFPLFVSAGNSPKVKQNCDFAEEASIASCQLAFGEMCSAINGQVGFAARPSLARPTRGGSLAQQQALTQLSLEVLNTKVTSVSNVQGAIPRTKAIYGEFDYGEVWGNAESEGGFIGAECGRFVPLRHARAISGSCRVSSQSGFLLQLREICRVAAKQFL